MTYSDAFLRVLDRYEDRAAQEEHLWRAVPPADLAERRDDFLLHIGFETAEVLLTLAFARGARRIVELGTSYGYSTLFLAEAARRTGGRVSTYELAAAKQDHARMQLAEAGLDHVVDWRQGDAVSLLADEPDDVDFVLIDLWKDLYLPCLEALRPKLADRALVLADNMMQPEQARADAAAYRRAVRGMPEFQSVLLPIGSGVELSCMWRGGDR